MCAKKAPEQALVWSLVAIHKATGANQSQNRLQELLQVHKQLVVVWEHHKKQ